MPLAGKNAVVVGRSNIVGMPAALLLIREDATVTVIHSRTPNAADICRTADVVIAACGRPEMVKGSWIKEGAAVIDVGINAVDVRRVAPRRPSSPLTRLLTCLLCSCWVGLALETHDHTHTPCTLRPACRAALNRPTDAGHLHLRPDTSTSTPARSCET